MASGYIKPNWVLRRYLACCVGKACAINKKASARWLMACRAGPFRRSFGYARLVGKSHHSQIQIFSRRPCYLACHWPSKQTISIRPDKGQRTHKQAEVFSAFTFVSSSWTCCMAFSKLPSGPPSAPNKCRERHQVRRPPDPNHLRLRAILQRWRREPSTTHCPKACFCLFRFGKTKTAGGYKAKSNPSNSA